MGNILPPARTAHWNGTSADIPSPGPTPIASRDFENWDCDGKGAGMGFGRVLNDGATTWQHQSSFRGTAVNGAFTLWVRRPLWITADGTFTDWGQEIVAPPAPVIEATHDNLILVAEGVAPFQGAALEETAAGTANHVARSKAVYLIEVALSRTPPIPNNCQTSRTGQAGHGAGNTGFAGCEPLAADALAGALRGSDATQTGGALSGGIR